MIQKRTLLALLCIRCISTSPMLYPNKPNTPYRHCVPVAMPRQKILVRPCAACRHYTILCLFARRANTIKCGLWACVFCHECIFLFPGRAGHALPWLLGLYVPTNAFFADSPRICTFPSTRRECRSRSVVSVFRSQRAPIQFFTTPETQQQFPPYFCTLLKGCCREGSVHKQTMPVLDTR